ncbi:MAG: RNA polymerase sigma factor [Anaerolineae bacterium]|nr:RNA polymerase sigma factor [Candidatus Roseilinea sp.]MDW8450933.1 RNA polymerase sigma factor [Anaerolineae bacterium]
MSDQALQQTLLQRAREFDLQALAEIYDLFSPALYRYAVRLLNDPDLAEECVTETFSRFLRALKSNSGPRRHLRAYLYRVAHNWITDHYRATQPASVSLEEIEDVALDHHDPSPLQVVIGKLASERIRAAIMSLTPDQRQVIVLKYYEGMTNDEVAAAIDKPVGAVKALQQRALAALRRVLHVQSDPAGVLDELRVETGSA